MCQRLSILLLSLFFCPNLLWAVEPLAWANLRISGNIIDESCEVGTTSADVHIGDFPQSDFTAVGDVSAAKQFDISLLKCSPEITGSNITFSGTSAGSGNTDLLALSRTSGSAEMASGVAVQILDSVVVPIALNKASRLQPLTQGDNTMHFQLRYKAIAVPVKAGEANAVMYFDLSYQ